MLRALIIKLEKMELKDKIEEMAFNFENEDGTFKESTIFLKDLYEIPEIKQLLLHNVSQQSELLERLDKLENWAYNKASEDDLKFLNSIYRSDNCG